MSLLSVVRRAKRSRIGKCVVRIVVLRATWCARPCTSRLCGVGRGRRPRWPARTHRPPASSLCVRGGRAAEDVRPYHVYGPARHMMCARPCTPRLCGVGRGRRPRRPAWTHRPPASSLCMRGAGGRGRPPLPCIRSCVPHDVCGSAHHGCAVLVGADVPGGPRGRIVLRRRPCACGGRAAEDVRPYHVYGPARHMMCARPCTPRLCGVGRGRRPRRPAWTHRPPASPLCVGRAAEDVRPYHVYGSARHMICMRPCAPHDARPDRTCGVGRGRRPRWPAYVTVCARHGPRVRGARDWGRRSRKWRRVVSIWPLRTSLPISVERADRSTLR